MALHQSTGLCVAVRPVVGAKGGKEGANDTKYPAGVVPVSPSRGLLQPGAPLDDTGGLQENDLDEMYEAGAVAFVVVPAFPREAFRISPGNDIASGSGTDQDNISGPGSPMVKYTMNNPRYAVEVLPDVVDDSLLGSPDTEEFYSVSASEAQKWSPFLSPGEARRANPSHEPDQTMSDGELSPSGSTGVWSIAGRV